MCNLPVGISNGMELLKMIRNIAMHRCLMVFHTMVVVMLWQVVTLHP